MATPDDGASRSPVAVALWHEVDDWKLDLRALWSATGAAIATFGIHTPRALRVLSGVERVHPTEPHRYLAFIGVHPEAQGRGHGGRLLAAMTAELDMQGLPAYLESSDPRNEALYVRHGFISQGPIATPGRCPAPTEMWRPPR